MAPLVVAVRYIVMYYITVDSMLFGPCSEFPFSVSNGFSSRR